ncbi:MAG: hypothetical protein KDD52_03900 [Bdellovibrionales bacterium]|nr:hypothetical protein [Bdellovibrionales bacterium]
MKFRWIVSFLCIPFFLYPTVSWGQKKQIIIKSREAKVYAKPAQGQRNASEVLMTLKNGSEVHAVGALKTGWVKIKVELNPGFSFDGWVYKSDLGVKGAKPTPVAKRNPRAVAPKKPTQVSRRSPPVSSSSKLDQFFESPSTKKKKKKKKEKRVRKTKEKSSSMGQFAFLDQKLRLGAAPLFSLHQYSFASTSEPIKYLLSGAGAEIDIRYEALRVMDGKLGIETELGASYVIYNAKTALNDTNGDNFLNLDAKNKAFALGLKINGRYALSSGDNPLTLIGSLGFQHFHFISDDIIDNTDTPLGLFVDQKINSLIFGLGGDIPLKEGIAMNVGVDALLLNTVKESPNGSSGNDPKSTLGYAPYLQLRYALFGKHHVTLKYRMNFQSIQFSGTSTQRVNASLEDAKVKSNYHMVSLGYQYRF